MPVRFPRPLRPGDVISVVAPSSGVRPAMHSRLDAALELLRAKGFRPIEGTALRCQAKGESASAEARASELERALTDPGVAAVMPPWGGERAIEILRLLDFDRLARAEPRWLVGFSDISTIQVPLLLRAGWASLHGPNLMQLPGPDLDEASARVFDAWTLGPDTRLAQAPSSVTASWRLDGRAAGVRFSGRLVGGCVDAISRLAGSPFGRVSDFGRTYRDPGLVVFLENAELKPFELSRALTGLRLAGWFDDAAGVLIGRNAAASPDVSDFSARDALVAALGSLHCPVIADVDIGHVGPQWSLVQGAIAHVDWQAGACAIEQHLR